MSDYLYPEGRIAIFAKAPVPGRVKTRMQPVLSPSQSANLQERLIQHTLNTAIASKVAPVQLWCAPDQNHPAFLHHKKKQSEIELLTQQGETLGQRMHHAFEYNQGFTLLIGTDCPLLTPVFLQEAALSTQSNAVTIAPAHDGGYVLIASKMQPQCFDNIEWGSEKVLQQSLSALKQNEQAYRILGELPDLDYPEDLARLPRELIQTLKIEKLYQRVISAKN